MYWLQDCLTSLASVNMGLETIGSFIGIQNNDNFRVSGLFEGRKKDHQAS